MRQIAIFFLCIFSTTMFAEEKAPEKYLSHRIPKKDQRYPTFLCALNLLKERKAKTIVETGTARCGADNFIGDGGSTIIFSDWAKDHHANFFSVDIDEANVKRAKKAVKKIFGKQKYIHFICSDSLAFLRRFDQNIDFLYLDSYDFDVNNPTPSQLHHLYEIQQAYPLLTEKSIVMIDDCDLPYGGKGKLAIEYLLDRGWKIIKQGYQVILSFKEF